MAADAALFVEYPLASARVPGEVNAACLVQERKNVCHFLRVQLGIRVVLLADLPPHAGSMVPQHRRNPPHCGSTGALSGEIRGNTAPESIDGMANAALLVTKKQCGTFLGFTDNVRCAAHSGQSAHLYKHGHHEGYDNQYCRDPNEKLFASIQHCHTQRSALTPGP